MDPALQKAQRKCSNTQGLNVTTVHVVMMMVPSHDVVLESKNLLSSQTKSTHGFKKRTT